MGLFYFVATFDLSHFIIALGFIAFYSFLFICFIARFIVVIEHPFPYLPPSHIICSLVHTHLAPQIIIGNAILRLRVMDRQFPLSALGILVFNHFL
jgi:hypothetical protein